MTPEQRNEIIHLLQQGGDLSPEWGRILFPPEKREYELVYHGKEREEDIIADTLAVPLQPTRTFGSNGADWHNMLIFGDNLQVMKSLLEMKKAGRLCNADGTTGVRLVYIDPPFATKKDFAGTEDQKAYQDKIVGAAFIEFLRKRLVLIRELVSDDGSVFVHLDWKKGHYIKTIMDEIFGEHNFINEVVWHYRKWSTNIKAFQKNHDTIFWYAKKGSDKNRKFDVVAYEKPSQGTLRRWKGKKQLATFDTNGRRMATETEEVSTGAPISDVWTDIELPEDMQLLDVSIINPAAVERVGYPTQKPEMLIDRIVRAVTRDGDLVLDSFAGSGTTCAVAEKLGRRWIGIDCGKLAIYTIQKRMLNLRKEIGNKGLKLKPKPFTLFNAGLYDFSQLRKLTWEDWRFFALQLFQCRDEPHKVGGIAFDGFHQGADVMVFNHFEHRGAVISEETIQDIHEAIGRRVGKKIFIIAPALTFDFQQDYIEIRDVRYYALRIPYSIIHELHRREFTALKQPADEMAVNDTIEAVGFDFIRTPEVEYKLGKTKPIGELFEKAFIQIKTFRSDAVIREPIRKKGNRETLSMVMLDFDYDESKQVFDLEEVQYADAIEKEGWKVSFRSDRLGRKIMAVFLDIYGNETRILIDAADFKGVGQKETAKMPRVLPRKSREKKVRK